jgi:hypothetical protein
VKEPSLVSLSHSAHVSDHLLSLAAILKEKGLSGEKYYNAGKRFIDPFFDNKKKGLIDIGSWFVLDTFEPKEKSNLCLELILPLIRIYKITNEEKYKKAVSVIKNEFFPDNYSHIFLPAAKEGDFPDFSTSLRLLKITISLEEIGIQVKDKEGLINAILPWIYFNRSEAKAPGDIGFFTGGILDSFDRCRIIYRGFELAYYLLKMANFIEKKHLVKLLKNLASYLIDSGSRIPLGIQWFHHTLYNNELKEKTGKPVIGPFNASSFVPEASHLVRLISDFPEVIK